MSRRQLIRKLSRARDLYEERKYAQALGLAFAVYHAAIAQDPSIERRAWLLFSNAAARAEIQPRMGPYHVTKGDLWHS